MGQAFVGTTRVPVTYVETGPCVVTQIKKEESDGYWAIQIGFGEKKIKNVSKPMQGHLRGVTKNKIVPRFLREVRFEKEPEFKTGILVGHMPMVSHIIDYFDERKTFDDYYLEPADFALINFEHVLKKNSGRVTIFKKNTLTSHKE